MSYNRSDNSGLPISIADICVLLAADNASLMDQIFHRYHLYSTPGKGSHKLNLYLVNDYLGNFKEQINITGGGLTITDKTYQGIIDFNRDVSTLYLNNGHALTDLEYFLRLVYAYLGFQAGGFLIHSAGVVKDGCSYLFFGPSGSGKSTVANLSPQEQVLNDDLIMLLPGKDHWIAHSTPFWNAGRGRDSLPTFAPLAGLYRLVKDRQNFLEKVSAGEALADFMASIPVLPGSPKFSAGLFQRCSDLLDLIPVYRLHFTPDNSFWDVVGL